MTRLFDPGRAAGLARLSAFLPDAGRAYAARRNVDEGPGWRHHVSMLSPWLRRRLVEEQEVAVAAIERFGYGGVEKFVQEVFWRLYFKGYLERRPSIWADFKTGLRRDQAALETDDACAERHAQAVAGRTGIDAFDHWARELVETGYLHNHARMNFASIWLFTLRLPWRLGADFTYRHFIDGDPASNTLSWRWVAGLHTRGKTYLARADIIERSSQGRFRPQGLVSAATPVEEPPPGAATPPPPASTVPPDTPFALVLTPEDLRPESLIPADAPVAAIFGLDGEDAPVGSLAGTFAAGALEDGLARAAAFYGAPARRLDAVGDLAPALSAAGVGQSVTPYAPVGPTADALAAAGVAITPIRRAIDDAAWAHATRGFFALKQKIPEIARSLGLPA